MSTMLGPNIFTDSARKLTTGQYMSDARQQAVAGQLSTQNALSVNNLLQQPFFGATGTLSTVWGKYGKFITWAAIVYAVVKWVLPMVGIRILWGKRGGKLFGGSRRRYSHLARARARSLAVRRARKRVAA